MPKEEKIAISQQESEKDWFYRFFKKCTLTQGVCLGIAAGIALFIWQNGLCYMLEHLWKWLGWFE